MCASVLTWLNASRRTSPAWACSVRSCPPRRREREVARHFQFPQRLQATIALGVAARVVKVNFLTEEIGQLGPVDEFAAVIQPPGDIGRSQEAAKAPA